MVRHGVKWCKMVQHGATWCNIVQHSATWCKMVQDKQDKTDVRADVRADVLNPMIFIKCNVFNTKAELIHL